MCGDRRASVPRCYLAIASLVCVLMTTVSSAAPVGGSGANNPGQQAKTFQESIASRYNDKKYKEAAELIEEFVDKFPTSEHVPANLNRQAHCYARSEQWDKFDGPLDECIKKFPGSRYWFFAYAQKLNRLKDTKDADKYLAAVDAMVKKEGDVPTTLGIPRFVDPWGGFVDVAAPLANWPQWFQIAGPGNSLGLSDDWWTDLLTVCQTKEQSAQAIRILSKLFTKKPHEIPLEWQLAHVVLLDRSGEKERADKQLADYVEPLEKTYKDYRVIALLARRAQYARAAKDDKTADTIFQKLLKDYGNCRGLAEPLYGRIKELAADGQGISRYDEFAAMTRQFVKSFPYVYDSKDLMAERSVRWIGLVNDWVKLAAAASPRGNQRPATDLLALLDELEKGKSPVVPQYLLVRWRYDLLKLQGRYADAAKVGEYYTAPENWSPAGFRLLADDAEKDPAIKAVVDAARKKYNIPVAAEGGPAAELLEKLRGHIKEEQMRLAEEEASELWGKHKTDANTIQGLVELQEYYFKKVDHEGRDKWTNRIAEAYPQHPLTHGVFCNQIDAENGRQDYNRMGAVLDTAMSRFPGSEGRWEAYWENQRIAAYQALKDQAGAATFLRNRYAKRIEAGDPIALSHVHWQLITVLDTLSKKQAGDDWVALGKRVPGTPMEIFCNLRAYYHYYEQVYWYANEIQWDAAIAASRYLRTQAIDPEIAWQTQYLEATLLAWKKDAPALAKALAEAIKDGGKQRDLAIRLDFGETGLALGKLAKPEDGVVLAKRLGAVCVTPYDQLALSYLQGKLWSSAEKYAQASPFYLAVAYNNPHGPAWIFPVWQAGLNGLQPPQYNAEVMRLLKTVPHAQDVLPEALFNWWHQVPESQQNARKALVDKYPASSQRDSLDDEIAEAQKPKPPPKK